MKSWIMVKVAAILCSICGLVVVWYGLLRGKYLFSRSCPHCPLRIREECRRGLLYAACHTILILIQSFIFIPIIALYTRSLSSKNERIIELQSSADLIFGHQK